MLNSLWAQWADFKWYFFNNGWGKYRCIRRLFRREEHLTRAWAKSGSRPPEDRIGGTS